MSNQPAITRVSVIIAITAGALMAWSTASVDAFPLSRGAPAFTAVVEQAKAPRGWVDFCRRHPLECEAKPSATP